MVTNVLAKNQEVLLTVKRIGINGEGIGYYKRLDIAGRFEGFDNRQKG